MITVDHAIRDLTHMDRLEDSQVEDIVELIKHLEGQVYAKAGRLFERQCQVCMNGYSKYDFDTGYLDCGCVVEDEPEVMKAYEGCMLCPKWRPYPHPELLSLKSYEDKIKLCWNAIRRHTTRETECLELHQVLEMLSKELDECRKNPSTVGCAEAEPL